MSWVRELYVVFAGMLFFMLKHFFSSVIDNNAFADRKATNWYGTREDVMILLVALHGYVLSRICFDVDLINLWGNGPSPSALAYYAMRTGNEGQEDNIRERSDGWTCLGVGLSPGHQHDFFKIVNKKLQVHHE